MSDSHDAKQFPDVSTKLAAPKKGSLFERQKQEAEAKRAREEAETAAVFDDFVKSFEEEGGSFPADPSFSRTSVSTASRQRFLRGDESDRQPAPALVRKSGPGTLGPIPSSLGRKRAFDESHGRDRAKRLPTFDGGMRSDSSNDETHDTKFGAAERAITKPTIQMSSLPLGTSPAVITKLLPDNLSVDSVRLIPPQQNTTDRKSQSAIVTFAKDTPASTIDSAVSTLQNYYLGWGFYLSLSRHLSSAVLGSSSDPPMIHSTHSTLPFGAHSSDWDSAASARNGLSSSHFAPPTYYSNHIPHGSTTHIDVKVPAPLHQVRLINKTIEALLQHGPSFEALLMARINVQRDEAWAWLWNPRSQGGVWYRWRLWEIASGAHRRRARPSRPKSRMLFEGGAPWLEADGADIPFEFETSFEEIVHDSDYDSSEEDDSGDESGLPRIRHHSRHNSQRRPTETSSLPTNDDEHPSYLTPLGRAKLIHLLSRLPISTGKLRRGDVARITSFAITHAAAGADEVAELLVLNVLKPLSLQKRLRPSMSPFEHDGGRSSSSINEGGVDMATEDATQPTLIALHCLSDILSASSTSGVRHSWKYRQLIQNALAQHRTFFRLGLLERHVSQGKGRIKADKWRRSVLQGVLGLWEGWGVFLGDELKSLVDEFEVGASSATKPGSGAKTEDRKAGSAAGEKRESKWRRVDVASMSPHSSAPFQVSVIGAEASERSLRYDL
ncbi:hypothetical protein FH972_021645 [Carpinus fangiana]|uniref:CID domain-containing protein n=1 Tax=Carpinus fangiana TaxID=176857 RepID=A0A5N6KQA4_9ROSI|nr:hypothetical protein FH972_021645 [Carpinus fangiana]